MHVPIVHGVIARRLLINYRVDPTVIAALLPALFRPNLIRGMAIAGICLIRLQAIRPRGVPAVLGITSENAAHRIAVVWDDHGQQREGVYISRRDTNSRLNTLVGGRVFPGMHHHAHVSTTDSNQRVSIAFTSDDAHMRVAVSGRSATLFPADSVFHSLAEASNFFERGSLGYSVTRDPQRFDGLELRSRQWHVAPFTIEHVESSFFDNQALFPHGTATLDCALVMRDIPHEWHGHTQLCSPTQRAG